MAAYSGKQRSIDREGRNTSSTDPKMMRSRIFIGNLAADKISRQDLEHVFAPYGKILGVSLHKNYGFVQFDNEESAEQAVAGENGLVKHGLKLERRKEHVGRRRGLSPSPPPRSRFGREPGHWSRGRHSPPSPPPPRFRGHLDRFRDPFYPPPRSGYMQDLRDDPYERYPPEPPFMRPLPPFRSRPPFSPCEFSPPPPPPHHLRERFERGMFEELEREREPHSPPSSLPQEQERKRPLMEIIVVNRQQREYAEMVRERIEQLGLTVAIVQLSLTVSLAAALDEAAQRGLLYTVIITSQHETHRSITLTILRGRNPQEHKNMPLEDAIGLIERDFARYSYGARRDSFPLLPPPPAPRPAAAVAGPSRVGSSVSSLMTRAAGGEQLTSSELSFLISSLQQQQQVKPVASRSLSTQDAMGDGSSHADSIQRQQADLQAKILSLLGSSAVVPASKHSPAPAPSPSSTTGARAYPPSRYAEDSTYGDYASSYDGGYPRQLYRNYH